MHEQDKAILQTLVSVAWADGHFAERERQLIEALLESFGADTTESDELRAYASTPRSFDDIPITELSYADRRAALQHAVVLSWVDGAQHEDELAMLERLRDKLHIPAEEATPLIDAANARAKELLALLSEPS
ncbi:MAG: TerB family tellurite resistance protein [Deltaproteobacteria bacterium]|nr:TerB family tellurite resistance protein [Deltaproteobacteria bacterium]